MNLFNRIVVFLLLLKVAALAMAVVVLAWSLPTESIDFLRDTADWLEDHDQDTEKAILTVIGVAVTLVVFVVLVMELLPRRSRDVRVQDLNAGVAVISAAALAGRLEEAVRGVEHVSEVTAVVRPQRRSVEVSMDLHVDAEANLAEVSDQALAAARDALTNRMHVALARPPQLRLHYRELRLNGGKKPESAPEQTALIERKPTEPAPAETETSWRPAAPAGSVMNPETGSTEAPASPDAESIEPPSGDKPAGEDVPDLEKKNE